MQAHMTRAGEFIIMRLSGRLDVESAERFRAACTNFLANRKVVFDFADLSFVGSSGILPFLETMQRLSSMTAVGFKFCNVGSEFQKIFAASPLAQIEIYENEEQALSAFINPGAVPVVAHAAPLNNEGFGFLSLNQEPEESMSSDQNSDDEDEGFDGVE
jgi:anti-anti-sigma factor